MALALVSPDTPASSSTARWRRPPWRSPADQPPWARPALLGVAAVAAVLYAWNIADSGFAPFYSVAARSMSESWKAFLFGAVDPAATITIDKNPGFLWPQALSARIFGFHAWALTLPQVIEGVVSVLVLFRVVRRWAGPAAGLIAAGIFALTPVAASMFGHAMEDGSLTMCVILAADAWQRAVEHGRLRALMLAGVWVGLGFQAKMMEAWAVLPAFAIVYLVCAPPRLSRRVWHVAVAGLVMFAVSASWMLVVLLTPADDRPYVDGTTNNNVLSMVFGYNGVSRFGPFHISGAVENALAGGGGGGGGRAGGAGRGLGDGGLGGGAAPFGGATSGAAGSGFPDGAPGGGTSTAAFVRAGGDSGWGKLFDTALAPEIGWLYPLAAGSLLFGLAWRRRRPRTDGPRAGFLMWGLWLGVTAVGLSAATVPHTAYVASLAAPIAALGGAGIVMFADAYRKEGWRGWVLPAMVVATVAWTWYVSRQFSSFLAWLAPTVLAVGAAAVAVLVFVRLRGRLRGRLAVVGIIAAATAMLATPGAWAVSVLDPTYAGSALDASAGPSGTFGGAFGVGGVGKLFAGARGGVGAGALGNSNTLTVEQKSLLSYVEAHSAGARYPLAVTSWNTASPYILSTGAEVLPMGGFSGQVPSPTLAGFQKLVSSGELRYVMVGGGGIASFRTGGNAGTTSVSAITTWVQSSCTEVPASAYGGTSPAGGTDPNAFGRGGPSAFTGLGGGETGLFAEEAALFSGATSGSLYRCG